MLFLWASYHQHRCHKILADLRKPTEKKYSPNYCSNNDIILLEQKQQLPTGADKTTKLRKPVEKKSECPSKEDPKQQFSNGIDRCTNLTIPPSPKYGLPTGDWFCYVSCPHLFAEILIYLSLLLCQVWSEAACSWWLTVVHVTSSLFLSARQMHAWYRSKFEDYPKNRTSLFPGLC